MSNEVITASDQRVLDFMSAGKSSAVVDPQQAQLEIVRRILSADTVDDVLKQQEAIHASTVLGQALRIVGIRFQQSDFTEAGPDFYMLVDCVTDNGEPFSVTCGAVNVMAQLWKLDQLGAFPLSAQIIETERKTKAGYTPMWLEGLPGVVDKHYDPAIAGADF